MIIDLIFTVQCHWHLPRNVCKFTPVCMSQYISYNNEILVVVTWSVVTLHNRKFDCPIQAGGQNKSLRNKIMLATCSVFWYRVSKGTRIKLHHLLLLAQRDPSCMLECLSIYRENVPTYQHTRMHSWHFTTWSN